MSVFVSQNSVFSDFKNSESWMILSTIERQIKDKIEKVGKPLKDWDISINYGIKTGFNDAFIISGEKRKELIEQDPKSEEIIRPILRGRDIKRYTYDFADLYIITTFPSLKIDIEQYPAVKAHLLSFGYDRLKQTGDTGARKKTNNQWFETQDSISYWDDFYKQKIVWKRVGSILRFSLDNEGTFALDSTCFATGKHIEYLVCYLNSKIGNYLLKDSPKTGTGDLLISVQAIEPILAPLPTEEIEGTIKLILNNLMSNEGNEDLLNNTFYEIFALDSEEIEFIDSQ